MASSSASISFSNDSVSESESASGLLLSGDSSGSTKVNSLRLRSKLSFMRECAEQGLRKTVSPETVAAIIYETDVACSTVEKSGGGKLFSLPESQPVAPPAPRPRRHSRRGATPNNIRLLERTTPECRAIATWICEIVLDKLAPQDPLSYKEVDEIRYYTSYFLGKALRFQNPPTQSIIIGLLYLFRIYPDDVPYGANSDQECALFVARLYLMCLRFALQWCDDIDYVTEGWVSFMRTDIPWLRNVEIQGLYLLNYNLAVSKLDWIRWVHFLLDELPEVLNHVDDADYEVVRKCLTSCRPSTTSLFSGGVLKLGLGSPGLPIDDAFDVPHCTPEQFRQKQCDFADCLTWNVVLPLTLRGEIEIDPNYLGVKSDPEEEDPAIVDAGGAVEALSRRRSLLSELAGRQVPRGDADMRSPELAEFPPVGSCYPSPESESEGSSEFYGCELKPVFNSVMKRPSVPARCSSYPKTPYPSCDSPAVMYSESVNEVKGSDVGGICGSPDSGYCEVLVAPA